MHLWGGYVWRFLLLVQFSTYGISIKLRSFPRSTLVHMACQEATPVNGVFDLYHFDTDLDPGCEKIQYGSRSRVSFDTDPNNMNLDPAKKD